MTADHDLEPGVAITSVTIGVCTYRRATLAATLASIAAQRPIGVVLRIVVVDNDDLPSARSLVEEATIRFGLSCVYVHARGRNISIARNACLAACRDGWMAFIDDDETAEPGWLAALLAATEWGSVAAVFGPVRAAYREDCPEWMRAGDFHSISVVHVGNQIKTGYTSNALMNLDHPAIRGRSFDPTLGRSGGEDTAFFDQVYRAGGRLAFAADAVVGELVAKDRQSLRWLWMRRFRYGQTHGRLLAANTPPLQWIAIFGLTAIKAGYCGASAVAVSYSAVKWRGWAIRGALHIGVLARMLGRRDLMQYGGIEKSQAL